MREQRHDRDHGGEREQGTHGGPAAGRTQRPQGGDVRDEHDLGHLLQEVRAGRVGILQDELPEPQEVRERRADAQVVVDAPPQHDGEDHVGHERGRDERPAHLLEPDQVQTQEPPEENPQVQREVEPVPHERERDGEDDAAKHVEGADRTQAARQPHHRQDPQGEHDREGLAFVQDVPRARGHDLDVPRRDAPVVAQPAHARADPVRAHHQHAGDVGVDELQRVGDRRERERGRRANAHRDEPRRHRGLVHADVARRDLHGLEHDRERGDRHRGGDADRDAGRLGDRPQDAGLEDPAGQDQQEQRGDGASSWELGRRDRRRPEHPGERRREPIEHAGGQARDRRDRQRQGGDAHGREDQRAHEAGVHDHQGTEHDEEQHERGDVQEARRHRRDTRFRRGHTRSIQEPAPDHVAGLGGQHVVREQRHVQDAQERRERPAVLEQPVPRDGAERERAQVGRDEDQDEARAAAQRLHRERPLTPVDEEPQPPRHPRGQGQREHGRDRDPQDVQVRRAVRVGAGSRRRRETQDLGAQRSPGLRDGRFGAHPPPRPPASAGGACSVL